MQIDPVPVPEARLLPPLQGGVEAVRVALARGARPPEGRVEIEAPGRVAGLPAGGVDLCIMHDVWHDPRTGLILRGDGRLPAAPAEELTGGPAGALRRLGARPDGYGWRWAPPARAEGRPAGLLWLSAGSMRNYGHYLFDSLTSLAVMDRAGLTGAAPALSPPARPWQADLRAAAGIAPGAVETVRGPVHLDVAIFTTGLKHYLQRNDGLLRDLAAAMQPARPPTPVDGAGTVYFSRRGFWGRIMVNEPTLENALAARGVRILRPERMSVAQQIAAMHGARRVIGPSGAALANVVFLPPGGRLVELRPVTLRESWLTLGCANLGLDHRVIGARAPVPPSELPLSARLKQLPRRLARRYHYAYEVDIDATLRALED